MRLFLATIGALFLSGLLGEAMEHGLLALGMPDRLAGHVGGAVQVGAFVLIMLVDHHRSPAQPESAAA